MKRYTFYYIYPDYLLAIRAHLSVRTHTRHQGDHIIGKDWTKEELAQASKAMVESGQMGYEKFRELLVC